jgi:hypothetical protein
MLGRVLSGQWPVPSENNGGWIKTRNTRRQTTTLVLFSDAEVATEGKGVATSRFENKNDFT